MSHIVDESGTPDGNGAPETGQPKAGQAMSDTDSFINEVTEEVRRDRLFAMFRRWAPVAAAAVVVLVGGAAWNEYRKATETAAAQQLGDDVIAALQADDIATRLDRLGGIETESAGGNAVVQFLIAAGEVEEGDRDAAVAGLDRIATNGDLPEIYRRIAAFKALTLQADSLPAVERRTRFEALAQPGQPLRLLAQEQLALIDIASGEADAAIDRLQSVLDDAEVTGALRERATQMIVALGGTPAQPASQG